MDRKEINKKKENNNSRRAELEKWRELNKSKENVLIEILIFFYIEIKYWKTTNSFKPSQISYSNYI